MIKFNPEKKDTLTYGECLDPAMKIIEQEDADQYLKGYIAFVQKELDKNPRADGMTAEQIAKSNLGYFAGYYDDETRLRVEKFFMCFHPIFGKAESGVPTSEEAFEAGRRMAGSSRHQQGIP